MVAGQRIRPRHNAERGGQQVDVLNSWLLSALPVWLVVSASFPDIEPALIGVSRPLSVILREEIPHLAPASAYDAQPHQSLRGGSPEAMLMDRRLVVATTREIGTCNDKDNDDKRSGAPYLMVRSTGANAAVFA
jgi:hypothetical protein